MEIARTVSLAHWVAIAVRVHHVASAATLLFITIEVPLEVEAHVAADHSVVETRAAVPHIAADHSVVEAHVAVPHIAADHSVVETCAAVPHTAVVHSAEAVDIPEVDIPLEAATVTEDVVNIRTSAFIIRCTSLIEHDA